jgi:hypothetical protein
MGAMAADETWSLSVVDDHYRITNTVSVGVDDLERLAHHVIAELVVYRQRVKARRAPSLPGPERSHCADCGIGETEQSLITFPRHGGDVLLCGECYRDARAELPEEVRDAR